MIRIECAKARAGSIDHWTTRTRYNVLIEGVTGFALTLVNDRERAVQNAQRLAMVLGYRVDNRME